MFEAIKLFVGIKQRPSNYVPDGEVPTETIFCLRNDAFWSNRDNLLTIDEIERAILQRSDFKDMPICCTF